MLGGSRSHPPCPCACYCIATATVCMEATVCVDVYTNRVFMLVGEGEKSHMIMFRVTERNLLRNRKAGGRKKCHPNDHICVIPLRKHCLSLILNHKSVRQWCTSHFWVSNRYFTRPFKLDERTMCAAARARNSSHVSSGEPPAKELGPEKGINIVCVVDCAMRCCGVPWLRPCKGCISKHHLLVCWRGIQLTHLRRTWKKRRGRFHTARRLISFQNL